MLAPVSLVGATGQAAGALRRQHSRDDAVRQPALPVLAVDLVGQRRECDDRGETSGGRPAPSAVPVDLTISKRGGVDYTPSGRSLKALSTSSPRWVWSR